MRWLDVGCGTGALTSAILHAADPALVLGCDPAEPFVEHARKTVLDDRVSFVSAGVGELPEIEGGYDAIVSGLVFNFLPSPGEALKAMLACLRPGGLVGAYVWDYAGRMDFLRLFWAEAAALDSQAGELDEGLRFPLCQAGALAELLFASGLSGIRQGPIDIRTAFANFSDFWAPFEQGTGPAPSYVAALEPGARAELQQRLRARLTHNHDGPFELVARAWAAAGRLR
jgi:SAM-dependent methyltransferase